jgi:uncharacterized membrane protein
MTENAKADQNVRTHEERSDRPDDVNVHPVERRASRAVGGALVMLGGLRRGLVGLGLGLAGAALIQRAATGHSRLYTSLRISTAHGTRGPNASVAHGRGVRVRRSITVRRSPAEVYGFWRRLETLPIFMHRVDEVMVLGDGRSHWRARAPFGRTIEWEAAIINDIEAKLIAWRSLPESQIQHAGSVRFDDTIDGNGTLVTVTMEYDPPAGLLGALAARLLGLDPQRQLEDDLRRLKALLEVGDSLTPRHGLRDRDEDEASGPLGDDSSDAAASLADEVDDDRRGVH